MNNNRIAIIENLGGDLGRYCYERIAMHYEPEFECFEVFSHSGLPEDVAGWARENSLAALIIDGSVRSPFCDDTWIAEEAEFIRAFIKLEIPMLAICFGHEILAHALGARLEKGERLRVSLDRVDILRADPLFSGFNGGFLAPYSHSVQPVELPSGFMHLASSEKCVLAAFRHERLPVYGVQFHPEVDRGIKIPDPSWNEISDEDIALSDGSAIMYNFRAIVKQHAVAAASVKG